MYACVSMYACMYVCIYVCSHRMSMHCMRVYVYAYVYICARVLDKVAHIFQEGAPLVTDQSAEMFSPSLCVYTLLAKDPCERRCSHAISICVCTRVYTNTDARTHREPWAACACARARARSLALSLFLARALSPPLTPPPHAPGGLCIVALFELLLVDPLQLFHHIHPSHPCLPLAKPEKKNKKAQFPTRISEQFSEIL